MQSITLNILFFHKFVALVLFAIFADHLHADNHYEIEIDIEETLEKKALEVNDYLSNFVLSISLLREWVRNGQILFSEKPFF